MKTKATIQRTKAHQIYETLVVTDTTFDKVCKEIESDFDSIKNDIVYLHWQDFENLKDIEAKFKFEDGKVRCIAYNTKIHEQLLWGDRRWVQENSCQCNKVQVGETDPG